MPLVLNRRILCDMNLITAERTYATTANAEKALDKALRSVGTTLEAERWLIAVKGERFVPVLVGIKYAQFAGLGIMVVG